MSSRADSEIFKRSAREHPPRADQVEHCPPHHWILEDGWQSCKKCHQREKVRAEVRFNRYRKLGTPQDSAPAQETSKKPSDSAEIKA